MAHIVIAGTGVAGLTTALRLAGQHQVTVVTKGRLGQSNTALAQGGIAGVLFPDDSIDSHVEDTLAAGAGLCDESAVRVLCTEGPARILELAATGVEFDRRPARPAAHGGREIWRDWARGLEGAHSVPRIYHSGGDATGREIIDALTPALRAEVVAGTLVLRENTMLVDVVTQPRNRVATGVTDSTRNRSSDGATGVTLLTDGKVEFLAADAVVLATGGAGRLYAHTTNPPEATGDGLAAAIRAGAAVRDMEFYQFHPTALTGAGLLISEAVRGAGAVLLDAHGRRFMPRVDPRGELAPRDVVALAIHRTMAVQGGSPCFLDARAVPDVSRRFPSITTGLAEHGYDLARDLIPVTPAAHYSMGGVATDLGGRTSLDGLYAVGEVACTGVHGANRLASNSLLEGAVFGVRAASAIEFDLDRARRDRAVPGGAELALGEFAHALSEPGPAESDSSSTAQGFVPLSGDGEHTRSLSRAQIQELAFRHLGVERDGHGLRTVLERLGEGAEKGRAPEPVADQIETGNLALIASTIAAHALAREESRGAHTRIDFPSARTTPATPPMPTTPLFQEELRC